MCGCCLYGCSNMNDILPPSFLKYTLQAGRTGACFHVKPLPLFATGETSQEDSTLFGAVQDLPFRHSQLGFKINSYLRMSDLLQRDGGG